MGRVDILLIPVGGNYTIDARAATGVCGQLKPKVIIPMHYMTEKSLLEIAGVEGFLSGKADVSRPDSSEVEFKAGKLPAAGQIIVLKPAL
jgi:L-ascorbate metabolism protein UlaG (beta-lactamase superfamily)